MALSILVKMTKYKHQFCLFSYIHIQKTTAKIKTKHHSIYHTRAFTQSNNAILLCVILIHAWISCDILSVSHHKQPLSPFIFSTYTLKLSFHPSPSPTHTTADIWRESARATVCVCVRVVFFFVASLFVNVARELKLPQFIFIRLAFTNFST